MTGGSPSGHSVAAAPVAPIAHGMSMADTPVVI
jgi:hypothetical protein